MNELYAIKNKKLVYYPHPGQFRMLTSDKRFVFMIAGTQGGKTSLMPLLMYNEYVRRGEGDYLAVTSTYDLFKLKFLPEMRKFFCQMFKWKYSASEHVIYHAYKPKMFTRIILRSASSEGGLESSTAKGAILDECGQDVFKYEAWEAIQRRLSLHQGRALGGTTPYNLGWMKTQIFDRWVAGDPDYDVIQFPSVMNPIFPQSEYDRAKRTLPAWRFNMFYNAEFTQPFGLIYSEYDESTMLSGLDLAFGPPLIWNRIIGTDFGGANTATIYLVEDPETKIWHAYKEELEGGISSKSHVTNALKRLAGARRYRAVGGAPSEIQPRKDWTDNGLKVEQPPFSDVEVGISNVIELFKSGRLKIHPSLGGLRDELAKYSRVVLDDGTVTNDIKDKAIYHRLDSLRYACSIITHKGLRLNPQATQGNYINGVQAPQDNVRPPY